MHPFQFQSQHFTFCNSVHLVYIFLSLCSVVTLKMPVLCIYWARKCAVRMFLVMCICLCRWRVWETHWCGLVAWQSCDQRASPSRHHAGQGEFTTTWELGKDVVEMCGCVFESRGWDQTGKCPATFWASWLEVQVLFMLNSSFFCTVSIPKDVLKWLQCHYQRFQHHDNTSVPFICSSMSHSHFR